MQTENKVPNQGPEFLCQGPESSTTGAPEFWRRRDVLNLALLPLGGIFFAGVALRRALYRVGVLRAKKIPAPVVVVGNIVAGGGGKTPLTAELANQFRLAGMSPGIVSRGFGGGGGMVMVENETDWKLCGDEPLLLRRKTGLPVCACPDRAAAAAALAKLGCDVIVSDDGLQHYAMARDVEICATQADYQNGNGWPLPAGPLREPPSRMRECDFVASFGGEVSHSNEFKIELRPLGFYAANDSESRFSAADLRGKRTAAFAGIARPERFFSELEKMELRPAIALPLPDHRRLTDAQLRGLPADYILTTEKDAVKYGGERRLLALETRATLPPQFVPAVLRKIGERK